MIQIAPKADENAPCADVPAELLRTLMNVGFIAANRGMIAHARQIFDGICAVRPDSEEARMGKAVSLMLTGKLLEPAEILADVYKNNPKNELARAFFALVMYLSKAHEAAARVAQNIIESNADAEAVVIAQSILDEMRRTHIIT